MSISPGSTVLDARRAQGRIVNFGVVARLSQDVASPTTLRNRKVINTKYA